MADPGLPSALARHGPSHLIPSMTPRFTVIGKGVTIMKRIAFVLSLLWVLAFAAAAAPVSATDKTPVKACPMACCVEGCTCCDGGACTCADTACKCCKHEKCTPKKCEKHCEKGEKK